MKKRLLGSLVLLAPLLAQTQLTKSVLGTVAAFHAGSAEIEIKPDTGISVVIKISSATVAQKIAPGQTDLSKAASVSITDIAVGDRVLATLMADGSEAKRIIVIPATDLAKRDAADTADWQQHGVAGVVAGVNANEITIEVRSLAGATKLVINTGPKTVFKRYAPDSVRYSEAKESNITDIHVGDHLRARGPRTADGAKVDAQAVVFGSFISKAGTVTGINAGSQELTIKDLGSNKPVTIVFTADSKVKRMPDAAAMGAMMGGRGGPGGPSPVGRVPAPSAATTTTPPRSPRAPSAAAPRPPDIAQMLDLLPVIKFEDLKVGDIAVVSATQSSKTDRITAMTFLANAEVLVQMAMAARGNTGPTPSLAGLAGSISNVGP